jgi:hypothetical protein
LKLFYFLAGEARSLNWKIKLLACQALLKFEEISESLLIQLIQKEKLDDYQKGNKNN